MKNNLEDIEGFQWDKGNIEKNWLKHKVLNSEYEQVFFNEPLIVADDLKHSQKEKRWYVLGRTDLNRKLFNVFAIRNKFIRIISARDMTRKEGKIYNEEIEKLTLVSLTKRENFCKIRKPLCFVYN